MSKSVSKKDTKLEQLKRIAPSRLGLAKNYSTMSTSGVVLPTDPNEEFLDKKFDPWRKI